MPAPAFTVAAAACLYPTLLVGLDILANLSVLGVISASVLVLTVVVLSVTGDFQYLSETEAWRGADGLGDEGGRRPRRDLGHECGPESRRHKT